MRTLFVFAAIAAVGFAADDKKRDGKGEGVQAFQGTWTIVEMEKGKKDAPVSAPTVVFDGTSYRIKAGDKLVEEGTYAVHPEQTPNRIEVAATAGKDKGKKWHGIYEIEGDTLRAVVGPVDKDPPKTLTEAQPGQRAFTLKRAKPSKP
jgi:uncharacterized protein (TIGR03067 family)